jgi:hypothetical protein
MRSCGTSLCAVRRQAAGSIVSQGKHVLASTILVLGSRAEALRRFQRSLCTVPAFRVIPMTHRSPGEWY